jgi:transposase InsO family protein
MTFGIWAVLRALVLHRAQLAAENAALRHQLAVLQRSSGRPRLRRRDRIFWVWLSKLWSGWREVLLIVQPETVVKWHRQGIRLYWRWTSTRRKPGRPKLDGDVRALIQEMSRANPLWGAPRIRSELHLLGIDVAQRTVAKYMVRDRKPPSQTWRTFLKNHVGDIAAIDFFTVPTVSFRVLFCFIVLRHERRKIVHFNVTAHPTASWTAQQIVDAFPFDQAPRYLLRDRDSIYGRVFQQRIRSLGVEQVIIAARCPWQNPYAERIIGSIRRECLDHVIVFNEAHLLRVLGEYFDYHHSSRPHLSLACNAPIERAIEPPALGRVVAEPQVGGLHHRYRRAA